MLTTKSNKQLQQKIADKMNQVKWHGSNFSARCPFHDDHSPSVLVYPDYFICKTCGVQGNLNKLLSKLSGISYHTSNMPNKKKSGVPRWNVWLREYGDYTSAAIHAHNTAVSMPSLLTYLKKRNISEFIDEGLFGWIDGWLSFPVMSSEKEIVDWTLRASPAKNITTRYVVRPRINHNESHHLYVPNWDMLNNADTIYCCFGIIDAWALYKAGLPSCTGISGKQVNVSLFDSMRKNIVIVPDRGEEFDAISLVKSLGWRGVLSKIEYPDNCKDPSDVITLHGVNALKEILM